MRRIPDDYDPVEIADDIASLIASRTMLPITVDHDPGSIAEAVLAACGGQEPQIDLGQLILEYKRLRDGIIALAEDLSNSDDMDELRLFLATVQEFKYGLGAAKWPAESRLQRLENFERYCSLSTGGATS